MRARLHPPVTSEKTQRVNETGLPLRSLLLEVLDGPDKGKSFTGEGERVTVGTATGTVCKISPEKNCLGCHMPKIPVRELHSSLTDHYIRVRRDERVPSLDPSKDAR